MTKNSRIQYMANIVHAIFCDGKVSAKQDKLFNKIAKAIAAKRPHLALAVEKAQNPGFKLQFPFSYSDAIRNLEDMLVVVLANHKLTTAEKRLIHEVREHLKVSKSQFERIIDDAKQRVLIVK